MGFVRLHLQAFAKKNITRCRYLKMLTYGRCLLFKHFIVDWDNFRKSKHFKMKTPLFNISIGNYAFPLDPRVSSSEIALFTHPRSLFVTFNSDHSKRAHSNSHINTIRQTILRTLNQIPIEKKGNKFVSILINSYTTFATLPDIQRQIKECFQQYLGKRKTEPIQKSLLRKDFFSLLFPFKQQTWNFQRVRQKFEEIHGTLDQKVFKIFLTHHYRIHSALHLQEMRADFKDFAVMLNKFDFVKFIETIMTHNLKYAKARVKRLVRILKWRSVESEQYLIFLINQYGFDNIRIALILFEQVYVTFARKAAPSKIALSSFK